MVTEQTKKRQKKKKTKQHNTLCAHHQLDKLTQQARNKQPSCTVLFAIPFVGCGQLSTFAPLPNRTPPQNQQLKSQNKKIVNRRKNTLTHTQEERPGKQTHSQSQPLPLPLLPHLPTQNYKKNIPTQSHTIPPLVVCSLVGLSLNFLPLVIVLLFPTPACHPPCMVWMCVQLAIPSSHTNRISPNHLCATS